MSRLSTLLAEGARPVVTAEFPSIDGGGLAAVEKAADELRPFVDAVNATDNPAAHAHASNTSIAIGMQQFGLEPIMQVVCRDKNRIAMQADIMGASLFGVENIACLTGDDVTAGDEPEARRVFDLDSTQLVKVASGLAEGHYLSGTLPATADRLLPGAPRGLRARMRRGRSHADDRAPPDRGAHQVRQGAVLHGRLRAGDLDPCRHDRARRRRR